MDSVKIQKALREIDELTVRNNQLSVTIGQLNAAADEKSLKLAKGHIEELQLNTDRISKLKKDNKIGYYVFQCVWNGNTYMPSTVVAQGFNSRSEADSYYLQHFKGKETKQVQYAVFPGVEKEGGNVVGFY